jgi:hypothetical protein
LLFSDRDSNTWSVKHKPDVLYLSQVNLLLRSDIVCSIEIEPGARVYTDNGEQRKQHTITIYVRIKGTHEIAAVPPTKILTPEDGHIGRNM